MSRDSVFTAQRSIERGIERIRLAGAGGVEILPGLGGAVHRLALPDPRSEDRSNWELLAHDSEDELPKNPLFRGRLLFPWNDRIPQGRYRFGGRLFELPTDSAGDGSALHGLLHRLPLGVSSIREGAKGVELELRSGPEQLVSPGYPFALSIRARYVLSYAGFELELAVRNSGTEPAPVAFGWHPYYRLADRIDGALLTVESDRYVPVDERLLPFGTTEAVSDSRYDFRAGRRIGTDALDVALTAPAGGRLSLRYGGRRIELFHDPALFRYVQLFVPPDRGSIAIEPVTAATDSFNRPELGLRVLAPGEVVGGRIRVSLVSDS